MSSEEPGRRSNPADKGGARKPGPEAWPARRQGKPVEDERPRVYQAGDEDWSVLVWIEGESWHARAAHWEVERELCAPAGLSRLLGQILEQDTRPALREREGPEAKPESYRLSSPGARSSVRRMSETILGQAEERLEAEMRRAAGRLSSIAFRREGDELLFHRAVLRCLGLARERLMLTRERLYLSQDNPDLLHSVQAQLAQTLPPARGGAGE